MSASPPPLISQTVSRTKVIQMTVDNVKFGMALFEELKQIGGGSIITCKLKYADVQLLKDAGRSETLELLKGSSEEVILHVMHDSPKQLAVYLNGRAEEAEESSKLILDVIFAGVHLFGLGG
jgi:hypothetical protein